MDTETLAAESAPVEAEQSLADHEAQFSNHPRIDSARQSPDESVVAQEPNSAQSTVTDAGERDASGRFKQRTKSQRADAGDVDRISTLTREYHEAVTAAGLDLQQEPGESPRVFELRKRVEIAKALAATKKSPTPSAPNAVPVPRVASPSVPNGGVSGIPLPQGFPAEPQESAYQNYTDYIRAVSRWEAEAMNVRLRIADEQQRDSQSFADGVRTRFTDAQSRYPDFKATVLDAATSPIPHNSTIELFTLKHAFGPDVVYYLFKHPDEVAAIHALPDRDDQIATLTLLGQRLTAKPSAAAASTRSPAAPIATPVVKPPNLVRSGTIRSGDEPLSDDASLADHERVFPTKRRR